MVHMLCNVFLNVQYKMCFKCASKVIFSCSDMFQNPGGEAVVLVRSMQGGQIYTVSISPPKTRGSRKTRPIKKYKYSCTCKAGENSVFCKHVGASLISFFTQPFQLVLICVISVILLDDKCNWIVIQCIYFICMSKFIL